MTRQPVLSALESFVVRAPLLPVEITPDASQPLADTAAVLQDPRIARALAVGGGDALRALGHASQPGRAARRARASLLRYLIRMSTRPTPYGLFAGVAVGTWGEECDLSLSGDPPRLRSRPDMAWLLGLVADLENRPEVRHLARVFVHQAVFTAGDRLRLNEPSPLPGGPDPGGPVSLRATRPVRRVLELARRPVRWSELALDIAGLPGADPARAEVLLDQLWSAGVLLTELRPPLTISDPAQHLLRVLQEMAQGDEAVSAVSTSLESLLAELAAWDTAPDTGSTRALVDLQTLARRFHATEQTEPVIQTDMAWSLSGHQLPRRVADEAERAAELLLRLAPASASTARLQAYAHAVEARWGAARPVPLLLALDPEEGLGPPPAHLHGADGPDGQAARSAALRDLALRSIRERATTVELDPALIERLTIWRPESGIGPASLELTAFVAAASPQAVAAGDFQLVIGPNVGSPVAGRMLGRFADLVGPPAIEALIAAADAESCARGDGLRVEVVYLPQRARSANVAIRPLLTAAELVYGMSPSARDPDVVPLDELLLLAENGQLTLRWPRRDATIVPCASHMLTTMGAPAVFRLFEDMARGASPQLSPFSWGPAAGFPALPRVSSGRIVLSPAQWLFELPQDRPAPERLSDTEARKLIDQWREQWQVPQRVYLTAGDNRLLLDLDDPEQLDQLIRQARRPGARGPILIQEGLPGPEHAWLPGPAGCHIAEIVVPFTARARAETPRDTAALDSARPAAGHKQARRQPIVWPIRERLRQPGSDWLYVKLYAPPDMLSSLLAGPVRDVCTVMQARDLTDYWFFIRYADPDVHLRLRWHGNPEALLHDALPLVCDWAGDLVSNAEARKFTIDSYDRELDRYGGSVGTCLAERLFGIDSQATVELLDTLPDLKPELDATAIAIKAIDNLLDALGMDSHRRVDWLRLRVRDRKASGAEYRTRQRQLRHWLAQTAADPVPAHRQVEETLARRREGLTQVAAALADAITDGQLHRDIDDLAASFVHLSCNRLLGSDHSDEERVLGLLLRTLESLHRSPLPLPPRANTRSEAS
jgi:lantibiotic biosynthesis protein